MLPHKQIELRLQPAVRAALPDADISAVLVRPCPDPKFGDYQSNALMSLAKARKLNPRQLATDTLARLDVSDICEKVEIAGAGFLNFRLKNGVLAQTLQAVARGEPLFFEKAAQPPRTVVIDFSSPNVAKPMHVGHIRSTILGDCLARTLRLLGHRVITDNHIGDWGTQVGKLLLGWKKHLDAAALKTDPIAEMERLYKLVNTASESDEKVLEEARQELFNAALSHLQQATALQHMAVQRAQRAVRDAEEKLATIKKWGKSLEDRTAPLVKQIEEFHSFIIIEMGKATVQLVQVVKALDAYAKVAKPDLKGAQP